MSKEKQEITFPLSEAISFAVESIRRRFSRALITVISIVLGIAFLSALLTITRIVSALSGGLSQTSQGPPLYQIWMAAIALLVCGVGIINSMLMSVTERYKEIGTLKTLGAEEIHILELFLIEGALMGLIGGIVGAFGGWLVAFIMYYVQSSSPQLVLQASLSSIDIVGISIVLSVILSLVSSMVPAYMASKLNPVEALRYEV
ncbi:MAG: ABC transporter permease [Candidatus Brockarchaeota archaeon]|nr:ABC transporter permease [Candidatus Brockarchaeota archaeon]MBO3768450.1 ABC transporter permease [Candidatus Brockarchaeota archaeon]MBO3801536.1 ABC transporter permease [Candidatus Brockarchaeota archaeon]